MRIPGSLEECKKLREEIQDHITKVTELIHGPVPETPISFVMVDPSVAQYKSYLLVWINRLNQKIGELL